jgi:hypothetical protein
LNVPLLFEQAYINRHRGIPAAAINPELVWSVLSTIGPASQSTVPAVILCRPSGQDNIYRAQCSNRL